MQLSFALLGVVISNQCTSNIPNLGITLLAQERDRLVVTHVASSGRTEASWDDPAMSCPGSKLA
jgi:hypothetical protein